MSVRFFVLNPIVWAAFLPIAVNAQMGGMGGGMGGGGGDDGGGVAENPITARWNGAVSGTGTTPRSCSVDNPQPNGGHIPYFCDLESEHTIYANLTGGEVVSTKGSGGDTSACTTGFVINNAYPNRQYVVAVGGSVCTDEGGCSLTVHSAINGQVPNTPYSFVKLVGHGRILGSTTLNPFACPATGEPTTESYPIETIEVLFSNTKGSKVDLTCLFTVSGTVDYEVTPDQCPPPPAE